MGGVGRAVPVSIAPGGGITPLTVSVGAAAGGGGTTAPDSMAPGGGRTVSY
jgi:hypothetical protein